MLEFHPASSWRTGSEAQATLRPLRFFSCLSPPRTRWSLSQMEPVTLLAVLLGLVDSLDQKLVKVES